MKQLLQNKYHNFGNCFLLIICLIFFGNSARSQNKAALKKYKIAEKISHYKIGDTDIKIVISKTFKLDSKFVYFNMHDNENTAVEATKQVIEKFGGTLVELQIEGERLINFSLEDKSFTFDPNRIFTEVGIEKTLRFKNSYTAEAKNETTKFAEKLKDFLKNARLIIAVHNNTNENYSIESYQTGGEFEREVKLFNINTEMDVDDFFYVTENSFFKSLKQKKQNVALQDNTKVTDDGSLAVYCAKNKISYINVESEHEHLSEQIKMLEVLQDLTKNFIQPKRKVRRK